MIDEETAREARRALAALDAAMGQLVGYADAAEWFGYVVILCATGSDDKTIGAKIKAYSSGLSQKYPAFLFTPASATRMGERGKFLPSYSEICGFLDAELALARGKRARLETLAHGGKAGADTEKPATLADRQRAGNFFGQLRKALDSGDFSGLPGVDGAVGGR